MLGFTEAIKSMIAYTHLMEFLPAKESAISGYFMLIDGLIVVITPLLLLFVS
jgi:hypothetical protein